MSMPLDQGYHIVLFYSFFNMTTLSYMWKHIKGMAISLAMLLLADLKNLVFCKGILLKAKLENFRF